MYDSLDGYRADESTVDPGEAEPSDAIPTPGTETSPVAKLRGTPLRYGGPRYVFPADSEHDTLDSPVDDDEFDDYEPPHDEVPLFSSLRGVESADLVGVLPPVPSSIRQATQGLVMGASALPAPKDLPEGMVEPPRIVHEVICYVDSSNIDTAEVPPDWDRCTLQFPKPVKKIKGLEKFAARLGVTISSYEGSNFLIIRRISSSPRTEKETQLLLRVLKANIAHLGVEITAFFEKTTQVQDQKAA